MTINQFTNTLSVRVCVCVVSRLILSRLQASIIKVEQEK